jgi:hypothetical protein
MHHVREGKHGARSTKQAIAISLSKARLDCVTKRLAGPLAHGRLVAAESQLPERRAVGSVMSTSKHWQVKWIDADTGRDRPRRTRY